MLLIIAYKNIGKTIADMPCISREHAGSRIAGVSMASSCMLHRGACLHITLLHHDACFFNHAPGSSSLCLAVLSSAQHVKATWTDKTMSSAAESSWSNSGEAAVVCNTSLCPNRTQALMQGLTEHRRPECQARKSLKASKQLAFCG